MGWFEKSTNVLEFFWKLKFEFFWIIFLCSNPPGFRKHNLHIR